MVAVEVAESLMVAPSEETPRHRLWLSDLDSLSIWDHTTTLYYFKPENYVNGGTTGFFSPEVMKESLSKTLVLFYPLAGRLVLDENGRREIDCTGEGSLFLVARSDSTLDELGEDVPSEETKSALIPSTGSGDPPCLLTMFQITFFKCGGVCLGSAMHHAAADGAAAMHFFKAWCDIARGATPQTITPPFIDRTVLRGREPKLSDHIPFAPGPSVTDSIKLSKFHVEKIKNLAHRDGDRRVSTYKAVAAHIWRCACGARELSGDMETRMYSLMDFRRRVSPPLPFEYLGNAIFVVSVNLKVDELLSNPLPFGVQRIGKTLAEVSVAPATQAAGGDEDGRAGPKGMERNEIWVTSWLSMPVDELDFGYGKPSFITRTSESSPGNFYLANDGAGGIAVIATLEPETMPAFKKMIYDSLEDASEVI